MSTLADGGLQTLVNVMKRLRPDGSVETDMAEVMSLKRAILDDIPWYATNMDTADLVTSRTGLPAPQWRDYNQGIDATKSDTTQYTETTGMLESRSDVDKKLADRTGNAQAYRMTENKGHLEAFSQTIETAFFYENAVTSPSRLHGLAARYPATSGYTASGYVLKGSNSGTNCQSIWLIEWGEDSVSGLYPKNSLAGLQESDKGELYTPAPNGKQMLVYRSQYNWDCGVRVKDYRKCVRFQWDPDDSTTGASMDASGKGLFLALNNMLGTIFDMDQANARFYMSRKSYNLLYSQLMSNSLSVLDWVTLGKRRVPTFAGIPIRITDSLVNESAIS